MGLRAAASVLGWKKAQERKKRVLSETLPQLPPPPKSLAQASSGRVAVEGPQNLLVLRKKRAVLGDPASGI